MGGEAVAKEYRPRALTELEIRKLKQLARAHPNDKDALYLAQSDDADGYRWYFLNKRFEPLYRVSETFARNVLGHGVFRKTKSRPPWYRQCWALMKWRAANLVSRPRDFDDDSEF